MALRNNFAVITKFDCTSKFSSVTQNWANKILHTYFLVHSWSEICDYGRAHLPEYSTASTYTFSCPNSGLNSYVFLLYFLPSFHWEKKNLLRSVLTNFPTTRIIFFCWKISIECGMKHCKCFCKPCYWPIIAKIFTEDKSFLQFWKWHNFLCETMCWCKQIGLNAPHTVDTI